MHRALLGLAAAFTVVALAVPSAAAEPPTATVYNDEKYVCVLTNSERNEGYCVKIWHPDLP